VHRLAALVGTEGCGDLEDPQAVEVEVEEDVGVGIVARESFAREQLQRAGPDHLEAAGRIADAKSGHQVQDGAEERLSDPAQERHAIRNAGERARSDHQIGAIFPDRDQQIIDRLGRMLSVAVELDDDLDAFLQRDLIPGAKRVAIAEVLDQRDRPRTSGARDICGAVGAAVVDHQDLVTDR